jgi:hypothetical protein
MKFTFKAALVAAIMLASGAMASAASAADWKSNGPVNFTGTAANGSRLVIHGTGGDVFLNCTGATGSGTVAASPGAGVNPWTGSASLTPAFSGCTVAGTPFTVTCSAASLDTGTGPGAYSGGSTLATANGGVTQGTLTSINCTLKIGVTSCSTVTGTVESQYTNPVPATSTAGNLKVFVAGQNLTAAKIGAGCAAIPDGPSEFGTRTTPLGDITYNVTSPATLSSQPYVWYGT